MHRPVEAIILDIVIVNKKKEITCRIMSFQQTTQHN